MHNFFAKSLIVNNERFQFTDEEEISNLSRAIVSAVVQLIVLFVQLC